MVLAFCFGYALTLRPLLKGGVAFGAAAGLAFAADTLSITVMEIVDNAIILLIPGAMDAGLGDWLFWASLAVALAIAFVAAYPVNRRADRPRPRTCCRPPSPRPLAAITALAQPGDPDAPVFNLPLLLAAPWRCRRCSTPLSRPPPVR